MGSTEVHNNKSTSFGRTRFIDPSSYGCFKNLRAPMAHGGPQNARMIASRTLGSTSESKYIPKDPYTPHLRTLVPKCIPGMCFGTRVLKRAVYGSRDKCFFVGYLSCGPFRE